MSDETLKPCPFCGGEAHVVSDYSSEHDETRWNLWHECCEHDGESAGYGHALFPWFETPWYKTEAEAIAAWNSRAERTCECVAEYAESPIDGKKIVLHRCSACHELMRPHMRYCPNCGCKVVSA